MYKRVAGVDEHEAAVSEAAVLFPPNERETECSFVERGTEGCSNTEADYGAVCMIGGNEP